MLKLCYSRIIQSWSGKLQNRNIDWPSNTSREPIHLTYWVVYSSKNKLKFKNLSQSLCPKNNFPILPKRVSFFFLSNSNMNHTQSTARQKKKGQHCQTTHSLLFSKHVNYPPIWYWFYGFKLPLSHCGPFTDQPVTHVKTTKSVLKFFFVVRCCHGGITPFREL